MSSPTDDIVRRIIELACRAPSVLNTQPWRWRVVNDSTMELYADRGRQLPISDPSGRNLVVSCGAAVHHSAVAARALGLTPEIELLPSAQDPDLLARITLSPGQHSTEADSDLRALEQRSTDRRRFTSWQIPDARLEHLAKAARGWAAHAIPITEATKRFRAEALLGKAMAAQAADPQLAEEVNAWIRSDREDGMPHTTASPAPHGRPATRPNRFASNDEAKATDDARAALTVESSDGMIAICSAVDDQRSWLAAGEALSALWLRATHDGLSVVPLSQVIEVEETRDALREEVFDGMFFPQVLIRVGWLEATREPLDATPRRSVDDVIER